MGREIVMIKMGREIAINEVQGSFIRAQVGQTELVKVTSWLTADRAKLEKYPSCVQIRKIVGIEA